MNVTILYKDKSDHAREVTDFVREFGHRTGHEDAIKLLDIETKEGAEFGRVYDIVEYPTILATRDDGSVLQMWRSTPLPLFDDIANYLRKEL